MIYLITYLGDDLMVNENLFYLMFLKYNILNSDYKKILKTVIEEKNEENLLDNILLLLERDPNFIYFDDNVSNYLYNLNNDIRFLCKKEAIFSKSAEIIRIINKLRNENIKEKRIEFFREELFLRTGQKGYFDSKLCDEKRDDFKSLLNSDFIFMVNLVNSNPIFINDNVFLYLSSISYLSSRYSDMMDDEVIETILLVLETIKVLTDEYYKLKEINNHEYKSFKRVIKSVHNNFNDYYERNKSKEQEIKKMVYKV